MTFGLGIEFAFIAFCQITLVMGLAYLAIGRWVQGRVRACVSAAIAAAYILGRVQQDMAETEWDAFSNPKVLIVLLTYIATILLFALRTDRAEQPATP
ncbi:MAG: hypothetical protein GW858_12265 [Sphingomonadales bacterium]|nr:hypothetical protein [Sphingomonadales bacterium]NCQ21776.1 hypothetical protein [Sphingomonadales bacterium]NCT04488.1 hypothetical protein [Sphingomonadales bacterium]